MHGNMNAKLVDLLESHDTQTGI